MINLSNVIQAEVTHVSQNGHNEFTIIVKPAELSFSEVKYLNILS